MNFNSFQQLIARLLLISLCLQSCGGGFDNNPLIPTEKEQIASVQTNTQQIIPPINIQPLVGQVLTAQGGHAITLYGDQEAGELKADVTVNALQGFSKSYEGVSVYIEQGTELANLSQLDTKAQQRRIHFQLGQGSQQAQVVIYKGAGIVGGMLEGEEEAEEEESEEETIPNECFCPITQEIMEDPVIAQDGHTYERAAIQRWFDIGRRTSPKTGARLLSIELLPNYTMRSLIQDLKAQVPVLARHTLDMQNIAAAIKLREEEIQEQLALKGTLFNQEHERVLELEQQVAEIQQHTSRISLHSHSLHQQRTSVLADIRQHKQPRSLEEIRAIIFEIAKNTIPQWEVLFTHYQIEEKVGRNALADAQLHLLRNLNQRLQANHVQLLPAIKEALYKKVIEEEEYERYKKINQAVNEAKQTELVANSSQPAVTNTLSAHLAMLKEKAPHGKEIEQALEKNVAYPLQIEKSWMDNNADVTFLVSHPVFKTNVKTTVLYWPEIGDFSLEAFAKHLQGTNVHTVILRSHTEGRQGRIKEKTRQLLKEQYPYITWVFTWEEEDEIGHTLNEQLDEGSAAQLAIQPKSQTISAQGGELEIDGLKLIIPKDAVKEDTPFSIKQAPPGMELPEAIEPLTPLYEVEPHNVEFKDLVSMSFTIPATTSPIALFIQKQDAQAKQLRKWLVIHPKKVEGNTATFEVRSFSFPFVGKLDVKFADTDLSLLPTIQKQLQGHNIIRPGLNYRAYCDEPTCPLSKELMIINGGGFRKFIVDNEMADDKIKCLKCDKPVQEPTNVKQLILFQAVGELKYKPPIIGVRPEIDPFTAIGNRLVIYGETNSSYTYPLYYIDVKPQPFNPIDHQIVNVEFDVNGNPIGSRFDLGVDGAYKNVKLLIGKFFNGDGFTQDSFENHVGAALNQKGFDWKCTGDENEFLTKLPDADVAWVISATTRFKGSLKMKDSKFPDKLEEFYKKGKGLMLWEDNDPEPGQHTTATLQKLFGMTVEGNDPGQKNMRSAADCTLPRTFSKSHAIMTGINTLYEGITICRPNRVPFPLKVLATSSSNHPNIIYVDRTNTTGRVIIDCGFTKLFKEFWDTAGTARYVTNATCWLSGFPYDPTM